MFHIVANIVSHIVPQMTRPEWIHLQGIKAPEYKILLQAFFSSDRPYSNRFILNFKPGIYSIICFVKGLIYEL